MSHKSRKQKYQHLLSVSERILGKIKHGIGSPIIPIIIGAMVWIAVPYPMMAAEYNPQHIDEGLPSILRLTGESMGGFQDSMKSYITYTAAQHVPGSKESGVGYYYDNKTMRMERNLFYRMGESEYPIRTGRTLDLAIRGKGFFVIELPGGDIGYTHDGRFERDIEDGHLKMLAYDFPVLGEKGHIYLKSDDIHILQGFVESSGATKPYIGLVKGIPEWESGFKGNVKAGKSYIQNITSAVQVADP